MTNIIDKMNSLIRDGINKLLKKEPWYKYYGDINSIKYPNLTIYELIEKTAKSFPNYPALEYYGKKTSYKDFIHRIHKAAKAFKALGVKEGDCVTICMPNTPTALISFYALNMIGAISSMIHPLSSENEIEFYLKESNSKYILTLDLVYKKVINIVSNTNVQKIIVSSVSDDMSKFKRTMYWFMFGRKNKIERHENSILYRELLKYGNNKKVDVVKRKQDDDAVILYSGGTTGAPKGVVLTNRNFNALAMQAHISCNPAKAGDSILAVLPIFHGFGLGVSIHTTLYIGMKVILVPDFSPRKFGSLIKKYRPNFITGVPTLYEALLKTKLGNNDLVNLTTVVSGGDTLTPSFKKEVDDYLRNHGSKAEVRCGYGLTEGTAASCLNPINESRDNSIGIPFPDMHYKIVEIDTTKEVKTGVDGEICISGPTVMKGYLNHPEETKKVLLKHNDGKIWLHTGDIGCMDEDGFIYFKQRLKRMIVSSGYNIYPTYIEELICKHEYVDTCAVIGIPHPYKKQAVKVFIVLKENIKESASVRKEIKKYCENNLAKYSWPYEYEYRDKLPTTLVGKVAIKELEKAGDR